MHHRSDDLCTALLTVAGGENLWKREALLLQSCLSLPGCDTWWCHQNPSSPPSWKTSPKKKRERTFLQQECEERLRPCSVCRSVGVIGASFVIGSEKNKREEHRNDKRPRPLFLTDGKCAGPPRRAWQTTYAQTIGGSVGTQGFLEVDQAEADERDGAKCQAAAGHFITQLRWWGNCRVTREKRSRWCDITGKKSWLKHSYVWNYSCMHRIFDFDFCYWYFYWALYLIFTFYFITLALHERRRFLFPSTDQNLIWKNVQKCSYLVMPDSLMTLDELTNSNVSHKGPVFSFSVCYSREKKLANVPFPKPLAWLRLRGLTSGFLLFLLALLFVLILKAATLTNK